jgi:RNA recognition motif-containing protein
VPGRTQIRIALKDNSSLFRAKDFFKMAKKLYVGNLSYNTTEEGLRTLFSGFGTVASAKIILDRETGNSKGFGFVEMGSEEEVAAAIAGTNGREFDGRQLRVNEAMDKPRNERGGGKW